MARKKIPTEHENHERWLVSYADFITLLFAFFVVMYAISSINEGKYRVLSNSLVSAFQQPPTSQKMIEMRARYPEIMEGSGRPIGKSMTQPPSETPEHKAAAAKMRKVARNVLEVMQPLIKSGQVRVTQSPRGVTVEINASTLFNSGDAVLQPKSVKTLAAVARVLSATDNPIQVEGHTDNVPINSAIYPSNWELSSARAGSVVRLFTEMGVPAGRMVAIGYADNRPLDVNTTAEGRTRNRRVNVLILNETQGPTRELSLDEHLPASPTTLAPPAAR
ncbi:MAG TPA: flagellar motor protein MotD [Thiobacillaceae bacterium]|nr:flagellar motor protein MotD [Thiobacillaceae bacterium]HNU64941.1 flagellar motor protein MotD [Thiobacillaceae bacterium]